MLFTSETKEAYLGPIILRQAEFGLTSASGWMWTRFRSSESAGSQLEASEHASRSPVAKNAGLALGIISGVRPRNIGAQIY